MLWYESDTIINGSNHSKINGVIINVFIHVTSLLRVYYGLGPVLDTREERKQVSCSKAAYIHTSEEKKDNKYKSNMKSKYRRKIKENNARW